MGKILVLGNKTPTSILSSLPNAQTLTMPTSSLNEKGERDLNRYVINNIFGDVEAIVIDVDKCISPDYCLAVAVSIRLSLLEIKRSALAPIILSTELTQPIFKGYKYSSIILTGSVYIEEPSNVNKILGIIKPLELDEYKNKFLNIIKILPNATEGRHSIANQWGAGVLGRIVLGNNALGDKIEEARLSMYFRYVQMQTMDRNDIRRILNGGEIYEVSVAPKNRNAIGRKILLIDDEADRGWSYVLEKLFWGSQFETISEKVPNYESLSDEAREKIEHGDYDLIFLDLRMNGIDEEDIAHPEDFSGMKILKKIKEINNGTQVIMFTASNKAWNLKALLDAGANGYYIKESPEYAFPFSQSESNAKELRNTIDSCLKNANLRKRYVDMQGIKQLISTLFVMDKAWIEEAKMSIDTAFNLLAQCNINEVYRAYAYLQLFLVIERYAKNEKIIEEVADELLLFGPANQPYKIGEKIYEPQKDKNISWKTCISMKNGHFILERGKYTKSHFDANFLISSLLIFKFGSDNSSVKNWTEVYNKRNNIAHPQNNDVSEDDIKKIINFMKFFFNEENAKWRDVKDALPMEEDIAERLAQNPNIKVTKTK